VNKAVFLDRDGVILRCVFREGKRSTPHSVAEAAVLPGVPEALSSLKEAGFWLFVVTNQPEVARGAVDRSVVERVNAHMMASLPLLDNIRVCYHDIRDECRCRKPNTQMVEHLSRDFRIDPSLSFMVGDRWRDTELGRRCGLTTVFIDNRDGEDPPDFFHVRVFSLLEASCWILSRG